MNLLMVKTTLLQIAILTCFLSLLVLYKTVVAILLEVLVLEFGYYQDPCNFAG
jgi:uncharacterized membrane protein